MKIEFLLPLSPATPPHNMDKFSTNLKAKFYDYSLTETAVIIKILLRKWKLEQNIRLEVNCKMNKKRMKCRLHKQE